MQCAPAFGAIPSTADLQKKRDEQDEEEDKQTQIMAKICSPDALATLNKLDLSQPEKAEKLRSQLYRMWLQEQLKNGPVGDAYMKKLIAELDGQDANTRGVALDRRRFGDDSDSDVDLDGL